MPLFSEEKKGIIIAFVAILANAGLNLLGPLLVGYTIDRCISKNDYHGVLIFSVILLAVYLLAYVANYLQMRVMGGVAQRTLWRLRNDLFGKLQRLASGLF